MVFTKDSQSVKNYVLLINNNLMTFDDVPSLYNLRDAVGDALGI